MTKVATWFDAHFLAFDKNMDPLRETHASTRTASEGAASSPRHDALSEQVSSTTGWQPRGLGGPRGPEGPPAAVRSVSLADGLEFAFVFAGPHPSAIDGVRLFGADIGANHPRESECGKSECGESKCGEGEAGPGSGKAFHVEEVSASGSVPTLVARNPTAFDYLLLAGQIVRGGKQNRGINADILIRAHSSAEIPVTCVEQGRWSRNAQSHFHHGGMEPLSVRSAKMREVHASRRAGTAVRANQQAVWSEIASMERSLGAESVSHDVLASIEHSKAARAHRLAASQAMRARGVTAASTEDSAGDLEDIELRLQDLERELHDIVRLIRELPPHETENRAALRRRYSELERDAARLRVRRTAMLARPPANRFDVTPEAINAANTAAKGACGMLVFFQGEFIAGDIFANPSWFETIYGDLRDSSLLSWDVTAQRHASVGRPFTRRNSHPVDRAAQSIVRDALAGDWSDRPSIAHGRSLLLNHPFLESSMIVGPGAVPLHILLGTTREPELLTVRGRLSQRVSESGLGEGFGGESGGVSDE